MSISINNATETQVQENLLEYTFINGEGESITTLVTPEVYEVLQEEQRENRRYAREFRRRGSLHSVDSDFVINNFAHTLDNSEDEVLYTTEMERLIDFLDKHCTLPQKRRYLKYHLEEYTLKEISQEEGCSIVAIKHSIEATEKKIKSFF